VIALEQEKIGELIEKCTSETLMSKETPRQQALDELKKLRSKFDASNDKIEVFRAYEKTLGVEPT
jgi:hypothetical protein